MSLALFGGTFDPVHDAHLGIAHRAADLCGLDRVLFIPSSRPPHRAEGTYTAYEHRYRMVELACEADRRFEASRLEEGPEKSYSIHTIERVREMEPGREIFFLIGADAFSDIETWFRWGDVVRAVTFIVVSRPGAEYRVPEGARTVRLEEVHLDISSSEVRRKLAAGDADVPVPAGVLAYIRENGLYSAPKDVAAAPRI